MYRIIDTNSREVLSLDPIATIEAARDAANEIEAHESQPDVAIQSNASGEWVTVA